METMSLVVAVLLILAVPVVLMLLTAFFFPPWLRARLSGEPVPLAVLIAMRVRGNSPRRLVSAYIMLRKQGHDVSMAEVETVCIARGLRHRMAEDVAGAVLENRGAVD